jgi:prepilin-type N-terminal cleavage/methylation domain-containing protein
MFHVPESKQKGFTLVELGVVLAVVAVALFFTITKVSETKITNRAQNVSRDLTQIIVNAQRLYSTKGEFPDVYAWNNEVLIRNNVFPASWVEGENVVSPFGDAFTIGTPHAATDRKLGAMIIHGVPSKVCTELGQAMLDKGVLGMWAGIQAGTPLFAKNPDTGVINLENLGLGCTQARSVSMAIYFRTN